MRYKFSDLYYDDTKNAKKLKSSEYKNIGKYIIVDQGKSLIAGYTDNEEGLYTDVPAIIFGDHTRNIKYIDSPFFLGADGTKVLKSPLKNVNYKYLYYLLKNASIPDTGYNRHFKWVKELMFKYHSQEQQNQIVTILDKLDSTIIKYREELSLLDELVKARFVEMFSKNQYEMIRLADVCTKITDGTHKTPNYLSEGITFISAKNIVKNKLDFSDVKYISEDEYQDIQKRCQTEFNDILLSKSGSLGTPVIVKTEKKLGLFESLAVLKYDRSKLVPEFLCEQLKTEEIQRQFKVGVKGVAIKHLHLGVIGNVKIIVPPLELQNEFASFVEEIDKSRSRIQKSLEASQELFDSLMQEYFG